MQDAGYAGVAGSSPKVVILLNDGTGFPRALQQKHISVDGSLHCRVVDLDVLFFRQGEREEVGIRPGAFGRQAIGLYLVALRVERTGETVYIGLSIQRQGDIQVIIPRRAFPVSTGPDGIGSPPDDVQDETGVCTVGVIVHVVGSTVEGGAVVELQVGV